MTDVYAEIRAERARAHEKHGARSLEAWPWDDWSRLPILVEEVGEVAREFNESVLAERGLDVVLLRAELIQVAAVAAGWIDAIDRANVSPGDDTSTPPTCHPTMTRSAENVSLPDDT